MFVKDFLNWFKLKPKMDNQDHTPPLFKEYELWWCSIGENIGTESSGKSQLYTRPVIIYKKLSRYTFLGIPTTTQLFDSHNKKRSGTWFVELNIKNIDMLALLSQIRVLDYRRLDKKIAQLDQKDKILINSGFKELYIKK
jgi:mRNA-degrading endonuclease toxin of MazEF toxin-antitoxin module